jgi:hypothetical protein
MAQNNKHPCMRKALCIFPVAETSVQHSNVKTTGITDQNASYQLEFLNITLRIYINIVASI